jgi:hypothetical protein
LGPDDAINLFRYVLNNPMRYADSSGAQSVDITSPGRPEPLFPWKLPADKLPQKTRDSYKLLHQYGFAAEIKNNFWGKSYERRVPSPRTGLSETAAQENPYTECVPTTIRNYLRIELGYDFSTEGIKKLIEAKSSVPFKWDTLSDISHIPTADLGRQVLNDLLPERSFFRAGNPGTDATEQKLIELAHHAENFGPVIIELPAHWYLLEGMDVINGETIFKIRDPERPDLRNAKYKDISFTGVYNIWKPSLLYVANKSGEATAQEVREATKNLSPSPPPADLIKDAFDSLKLRNP